MYLEINGWNVGIKFSACHMIPNLDKCSRLHGHIYAINARIQGEQNDRGMIFDFLRLKKTLRAIAEELDHKILLPKKSELMGIILGNNILVSFGKKTYQFPKEDVALLEIKVASAEELAKYVLRRIVKEIKFPKNIKEIEIGVDEGKGQGAWAAKKL